MAAVRRSGALLAWSAALLAVIVIATALGRGALAGPALTEPGTWSAWTAARPAPDAVMAVLRLVVLALAWYLLVVTAVAVAVRLGRAGRAGRLVTVADVVTIPLVRSVVQAGLGFGVAGATVVAVVAEPPVPMALAASTAPVLQRLPDDATAPPELRRLPDPAPAPAAGPTWSVAPGDHLWSIAERTLEAAWARPPTDAEVRPYWAEVVDRNRTGLADPANPDLLFPGQAVLLPTAAARALTTVRP